MRVCAYQADISWEDVERNLARADRAAEEAKASAADLLVLPEMFATGFSMHAAKVSAFGDRIAAGVAKIASDHEIAVLAGLALPGVPRPRNAALAFGREGEPLASYEKVHPFSLAGEHLHYAAGERVVTFRVDDVRVTPLICYDLRFPELFRLAAADTDLFCVIANWPAVRSFAWLRLLPARAIENQAYVLGVNRTGSGDGLAYSGDSILLDPLGQQVAAAASDQEMTFCGVVDPAAVKDARDRLGFLADRRPDVYRRAASERGS